jgi:hypothetical protein
VEDREPFSDADTATIAAALDRLGVDTTPSADVARATFGTDRIDAAGHRTIRERLARLGSKGVDAFVRRPFEGDK